MAKLAALRGMHGNAVARGARPKLGEEELVLLQRIEHAADGPAAMHQRKGDAVTVINLRK